MMVQRVPIPRKEAGFTLLEVLFVIAIMAILAAFAAPAYDEMIDKYRTKSASEALYIDLQLAKSEAIKQNQPVFISIQSGDNWCWGYRINAQCDCSSPSTSANFCNAKRVEGTRFKGVRLSASTFPIPGSGTTTTQTSIDQIRGIASHTGKVVFTSAKAIKAEVHLSKLGMPRLCSPAGANAGYPAC